ncbi:MAG TPA: hypothetical protein VER08_03465 [Pyrinomonadaceae bacterium]|nr:hypothetical protein [Pyrinomonadaceae bacterium]
MTEQPEEKIELRLSAGEFAFVLGVRHDEQYGLDLVKLQLGLLTDEEARLVMNVSSHSLMARRLLSVGGDGSPALAPELERAVRLFIESDWMIQCNRAEGDEDPTFLSFHFGAGGLLQQSVEDEVTHAFEILPRARLAAEAAARFYEVPRAAPREVVSYSLPEEVLSEVRQSQDGEHIRARLGRSGVPGEVASALAADFLRTRFLGSVVRVEHDEGGTSLAQHRFFLLKGAERLWLLRPRVSEAERAVEFFPATRESLAEAFRRVVEEPRQLRA